MKKIFTLLFSLGILTSVFAQSDYGYSRRGGDDRNYNAQYGNNDNGYNRGNTNYGNYDHHAAYDNGRYYNHDRDRQYQIDQVNRDYDRRIDVYRRDRSINDYERSRRIQMMERERNERVRSFGGGVILGTVLGVLLAH
jgi:hypothetical protein